MLDVLRHKQQPAPTPDLFDWLEGVLPATFEGHFEPLARAMRLEDKLENNKYTVRAELPGMDPDRDVEITVDNGVLTISAERREEKSDKDRSEFRYGAFFRRVSLPQGARTDDLKAAYKDGILEVTVPVTPASVTAAKKIPISRGKSN